MKDFVCPYSRGSGWLVALSGWLSSSWTRQVEPYWALTQVLHSFAACCSGCCSSTCHRSQPCWANSLRHPCLTEPPLLRWYFLRWSHLFPSLAHQHSDSSIFGQDYAATHHKKICFVFIPTKCGVLLWSAILSVTDFHPVSSSRCSEGVQTGAPSFDAERCLSSLVPNQWGRLVD